MSGFKKFCYSQNHLSMVKIYETKKICLVCEMSLDKLAFDILSEQVAVSAPQSNGEAKEQGYVMPN